MRLILLSLFLSLVFRPTTLKAQVVSFAEYQLQDEAVLIDTVDDNDSVS